MEKFNSANRLLFLGGFVLVVAVVEIYTGKVWIRWSGTCYRDKEPGRFWRAVGMSALIGLFLIGYSFYLVGMN